MGYASQSLSKSKSCYATHKLEFLALNWVVTTAFHEYLYGNTFQVKSDNNPLTYVLTTACLDATRHWWVAQLVMYNFGIQYKAGQHPLQD